MTTQTMRAPEIKRHEKNLRAKLIDLLSVALDRDELRAEALADPDDQVRSNADREMVIQRFGQKANRVYEIRLAIGKIEEGTYGFCERCDEPISQRRLDAVPWAKLCLGCQRLEEQEHGIGSRREAVA